MSTAFSPIESPLFPSPSFIDNQRLCARRKHGRPMRLSRAACMSSSTEGMQIQKSARVAALPPPPFVSMNPFISALYSFFSKTDSAEVAFREVMSRDVTWETPLFEAMSFKEATESLNSFKSFAIEPTIAVYSVSESSDGFCFKWTLSFTYPLPWRPRVAVSGESEVQRQPDGFVRRIKDDWFVAPFNIIRQSLPALTDLLWLWPSPHAEKDVGTRRVLRRKKSYSVVRQASRAIFTARSKPEDFELQLVFALPAIPEFAFEGGLRRREIYSTVSPITVQELDGGIYEWSFAIPGTLVGSSDVLAKAPSSDDASIEVEPERILAIFRYNGHSTRKRIYRLLQDFKKELRDDGLLQRNVELRDVYVRTYNAKAGFNSKGFLAMSMFGTSRIERRVNEMAIDITEEWQLAEANSD